jgi:hypothetical protein
VNGGRTWILCQDHRKTLDEYARVFPPAVETAEKALAYLLAMAEDETRQEPGAWCPACAIGEDRLEDADYACLRAVRCALPPDLVPLDAVLTIVPEVSRPGQASIVFGEVVKIHMQLCDHRQNPLPPIRIEAHTSGPARMGKHLRFVLTEISPGVWKLAPSLNVPGVVRAFLTFVPPR